MKIKNTENEYHVNYIQATKQLPEKIQATFLKLQSKTDITRIIRSYYAKQLNTRGLETAVAPKSMSKQGIDIICFSDPHKIKNTVNRDKIAILKTKTVCSAKYRGILENALTRSLKYHLRKKGWIKLREYVKFSSIYERNNFKPSFAIQTEIIDNKIGAWIKAKYRFIKPLEYKEKDKLGTKVRVLPSWSGGTLDKVTQDLSSKELKNLWNHKHKLKIKNPNVVVGVRFDEENQPFTYPLETVFHEFKEGSTSTYHLTISPNQRVKKVSTFVQKNLNDFIFLNNQITFQIYQSIESLGFKRAVFSDCDVILSSKSQKKESVKHKSIVSALEGNKKPVDGSIGVNYLVITPHTKYVDKCLCNLEKRYRELHLGTLNLLTPPIITKSDMGSIFTINSKLSQLSQTKQIDLCLVILPRDRQEAYYDFRRAILSKKPHIPTQSIEANTVTKCIQNNAFILTNLVTQIYIKAGGFNKKIWLLSQPADIDVFDNTGGKSLYGYFDVSRRIEEGTHASVYTSLTDPYGRLINTDNFPSSKENLSPHTAYQMVFSLIYRACNYEDQIITPKRLVFAKDGRVTKNDIAVLQQILYHGIPENDRKPIQSLLKQHSMLPDEFTIDLIGINKSPKKEILKQQNSYYSNVSQGTMITLSDKRSLLVSADSHNGVCRPLEITFHEHFDLNHSTPIPTIEDLTHEYYRLTFLNWNSLYKKGKLALPQVVTQAIGENLTKGVNLPPHYLPI